MQSKNVLTISPPKTGRMLGRFRCVQNFVYFLLDHEQRHHWHLIGLSWLNGSKPSEHPPTGEKLSKYLGGNIGCRDQKGSPMFSSPRLVTLFSRLECLPMYREILYDAQTKG